MNSTTSIAAPRGITEDSFKLTLDKFKNQAFKDFAAKHQVNYLQQNLRKPVGVTARACAGKLQEISNYLEFSLGPHSNVPLTEGDLINILNQMVPAQWRRSMISINFQPFNKSMTEVIEYMTRKIQKIRLESPKTRLRNFPRNILSPRAGRGREMKIGRASCRERV